MPVGRQDLIKAVAGKANKSVKETTEFVNATLEAIRETLENLARQLDPEQFARISRSELVNLDRIKEMQPWFHGERRIVLRDGRELTWTRRFRASSSRA